MIIHTNILALPLILLVWVLDAYLLIAFVRLVLSRVSGMQSKPLYLSLQQLTDGIPSRVNRWIAGWRDVSNPSWLPWLVVLVSLIVIRHLVVWVLVTVFA